MFHARFQVISFNFWLMRSTKVCVPTVSLVQTIKCHCVFTPKVSKVTHADFPCGFLHVHMFSLLSGSFQVISLNSHCFRTNKLCLSLCDTPGFSHDTLSGFLRFQSFTFCALVNGMQGCSYLYARTHVRTWKSGKKRKIWDLRVGRGGKGSVWK